MPGPLDPHTLAQVSDGVPIEYIGVRAEDGSALVWIEYGPAGNRQRAPLPAWDRHGYHLPPSRTGQLEWGYGGTGPHTLAFSILIHALQEFPSVEEIREGESVAWLAHQEFTQSVVSRWPQEGGWRLPLAEVYYALRAAGYPWAGDPDFAWDRPASGLVLPGLFTPKEMGDATFYDLHVWSLRYLDEHFSCAYLWPFGDSDPELRIRCEANDRLLRVSGPAGAFEARLRSAQLITAGASADWPLAPAAAGGS